MSEKVMENNKVSVIGTVVSEFTFSHEVFGEGFYLVDLSVSRLSEQADIIPLMISERLIDVTKNYEGCTVEAIGQFRSYNRHEGAKNRLVLSVFVREVNFLPEFTDYTKTNQIFLDGYICKEPIYRKTPLGREIADILLAVNRPLREIGLHPLHRLGQERQVRIRLCRRHKGLHLGARPKPGVHEKIKRRGMRKEGGLRGFCQQTGV